MYNLQNYQELPLANFTEVKEQQKRENTDSELSKTSRQYALEIVYVLYVKSHLHSKMFSILKRSSPSLFL